MRFALVAAAIAALLGGCSERDRNAARPVRDPQPPRTVIVPPTGTVRPLPPHAIRADGVGPYKLGVEVASVLQHLPSGPRIARIEIPNIVRTSVIRAEDDTVLIGGETAGTAEFVAVVGPEVAFTESGVHVGSTRVELELALGPLVDDLDRARDPRLAVPSKLRNARVVMSDDRVSAIVIVADAGGKPSESTSCARPRPTAKAFGTCMGGGELVELDRGELLIRPLDAKQPLAPIRVPNAVFAAPLRNAASGRDELVVISRVDDEHQRRWSITAYRLDGAKLVGAVEPELLYTLSSAQTRWIGAELRDVDLYLELTSRADGIEVGGLLTTRAGEKIRDVAVISTILVARRHASKPSSSEASDAGVPGASFDAAVQVDALAGADSANP